MANEGNTRPCPLGRPTNIMYLVDKNNDVFGMCLRAFDCSKSQGSGCPLAGKTRRQWHRMKPPPSGGCLIATACIEAKGLPDDCPELNTLRLFRDEYIKSLPNGNELIVDYYENAPKIINEINKSATAREVYLDLYEKLVLETLGLIQLEKNEEALRNLLKIYNNLKHHT